MGPTVSFIDCIDFANVIWRGRLGKSHEIFDILV